MNKVINWTIAQYSRASVEGSHLIGYIGMTLIGTAIVGFFVTILPYSRSFPYSDEWHFIRPLTSYSASEFTSWLFIQHVDHRIPIQKLVYAFSSWLSGFDFRAVVGINYLIACGIAVLMMSVAKKYRGKAVFGDLFIPACALNLGHGALQWGFDFQFLSSAFFVALFLYLVITADRTGRAGFLVAALIALFASAWCGLNGMVLSSFLAMLVVGYFVVERVRKRAKRGISVYAAAVIVLLTNVLMWLNWTPSGASAAGGLSIVGVAKYMYGLSNACLVIYGRENFWAFGILIMLVLSALFFGIRSSFKDEDRGLSHVTMLGALCATLLLMVSIAAGRSSYMGWVGGADMHYGYLTVLMPITAWIIVSANVGRKAQGIIGLILVSLFAFAYLENSQWRYRNTAETRVQNLLAKQQLATSIDAQSIADKYISDYFFVDDLATRTAVAKGISLLRQHGGVED